jgi:hypothetical protein
VRLSPGRPGEENRRRCSANDGSWATQPTRRRLLPRFVGHRPRPGTWIRHHETPMYNSLFRADDEMLVTPHLYALKGYRAPIFLLRRTVEDGIFDNFVEHFERVWAQTAEIG